MRQTLRRLFAGLTGLTLVGLVGACAADGGSEAPTESEGAAEESLGDGAAADGLDLSGVELSLLIHPTLYGAIGGDDGIVPEFEELTGATVHVVTAPIGEHIERAMAEFAAGSGRFDVINFMDQDLHEEVRPFLLDLAPYIEAAPDDWDYGDFPESLRDHATTDEGVIATPFRIGVNVMYYRQDLLDEAGVEAPASFEELRAVSAALADTHPDIVPLVQRGQFEELPHDWLGFLHAAGGQVLSDDNSVCEVNSDAGVAAAELFRDLYADGHLPPDFFSIGRDDYIEAMRQGRAAMGVYFSPYWGTLTEEGPEFADQISWSLHPTEPGVEPGRAWFTAWYLTASRDSANPDAAWALIQYITNPENSLRSALEWANGPVRQSTYLDSTYTDRFPLAADWLTAVAASSPVPAVPQSAQIVDILSEELTAIIDGSKEASQGLDDACNRIDGLGL